MRVCVGILAGGRSERMGCDKASVSLAGMTLGERALALARTVTSDVVALGHARGMPSIDKLADDPASGPSAGPIGAIRALLASARAEVYVVVPVDMPLLHERDLHALVDALDAPDAPDAPNGAHFAQHPLPCAFRARAIDGMPVNGSVYAALAHAHARAIAPLDEGRLENVNTFEDVDRASRRLKFE